MNDFFSNVSIQTFWETIEKKNKRIPKVIGMQIISYAISR